MSLYKKFLKAPEQAKALDKVTQNCKKRLAEVDFLEQQQQENQKKSKPNPLQQQQQEQAEEEQHFYPSEEEDEESRYEAFYTQFMSLENRLNEQNSVLQRDWLALKPRLESVIRERRALEERKKEQQQELTISVDDNLAEIESLRNDFQTEVNRLKDLEAEFVGRDLEAETAQATAEKQALFRKFTFLQNLPMQTEATRKELIEGKRHQLNNQELRALTRHLDLNTLLSIDLLAKASHASGEGHHQDSSIYYGEVKQGDNCLVMIAFGQCSYIMVHGELLLL